MILTLWVLKNSCIVASALSVCACVCVCVHVHACMRLCVHACVHVCVHAYACTNYMIMMIMNSYCFLAKCLLQLHIKWRPAWVLLLLFPNTRISFSFKCELSLTCTGIVTWVMLIRYNILNYIKSANFMYVAMYLYMRILWPLNICTYNLLIRSYTETF